MKWTKKEIAYLINNYETKTHQEISQSINKTKRAIEMKCIRMGFRKKGISKEYYNKGLA